MTNRERFKEDGGDVKVRGSSIMDIEISSYACIFLFYDYALMFVFELCL
jgi:hypothetical protein